PLTCPSVPQCVSCSPFHRPSCIPGGRHLQCVHLAVIACGFTAGYPLCMRFMNGPVVFWGLSHFPKDYSEGGRIPSNHLGQGQSEVGAGTCQILVPAPPCPPKVPILNGEQSLKQNFPFWVELRF
ncbi:unnamed protein product, partial [Staurois parvus]